MDLKITLASVESPLADAWERHCGQLPGVSIHRGSILDLRVDAVVSPANSFGFMDGGIDHVYSRRFGWDVQKRLQEMIRTRHHGELLIGAAEIVETHHAAIPYVIAAPTMRVPMILTNTVNPYLAARAVLLLIRHGVVPDGALAGEPVSAAVNSVAFPGLGTGTGRVSPDTCAIKVRAAIEEVLMGRLEFPRSWMDAQERHQFLYTDHARDLQR
ncbi:MAG: macro domain-containing protein [Planctomycetota bacterium]|nr:macro domain-containing protein [Planctomycetota bacterium]